MPDPYSTLVREWRLSSKTVKIIRELGVKKNADINLSYPDLAFYSLLSLLVEKGFLASAQIERLKQAAYILIKKEIERFQSKNLHKVDDRSRLAKFYDLYHTMGHNLSTAVMLMILVLVDREYYLSKREDLEELILTMVLHDALPEAEDFEGHALMSDGILTLTLEELYKLPIAELERKIKQIDIKLKATDYSTLPFKVNFNTGKLRIDYDHLTKSNLLLILSDWLGQSLIIKSQSIIKRVRDLETFHYGEVRLFEPLTAVLRSIGTCLWISSDKSLETFAPLAQKLFSIYAQFDSRYQDLLLGVDLAKGHHAAEYRDELASMLAGFGLKPKVEFRV